MKLRYSLSYSLLSYLILSLAGLSSIEYCKTDTTVKAPEKISIIKELNDQNLNKALEDAKKPVVLQFFADWCAPCKSMKPLFEKFAQELQNDFICYKVNYDKSPNLALKYSVNSLPTFIIIQDNKVKEKVVGKSDYETLKNKIISASKTNIKALSSTELNLKLFQSLQTCSIDEVKKYIKAGANVNEPIPVDQAQGVTPLMFAVSYCTLIKPEVSIAIIEELVQAGADINAKVNYPMAPNSITARELAQTSISQFKRGIECYEKVLDYFDKEDSKKNIVQEQDKDDTSSTTENLKS